MSESLAPLRAAAAASGERARAARPFLVGAACAAVLAVLVLTDPVTAGWFTGLRTASLHDAARWLSELGAAGTCVAAALAVLALGVALDRPAWSRAALAMLGAIATTALLVCLLKPLIGRQEAWFKGAPPPDPWPWNWGRFPSGHAAIVFTLATVLAGAVPRLAWPAMLWAGVASLARVLQGAHLPSDVFAGACLGLVVGGFWVRRYEARQAQAAAQPAATASPTLRALVLIALIVLPVCFWKLGAPGLSEPDEARYAEIPREMLARGDLVTPTLNGVLYFEKPPLLYWLVAGAFRLLGTSELAGRLVPALAATLGVLLAWWLGRRLFGQRAGLLGAAILATSLLWAIMARVLVIDTLFSVLVFAALALWWCGHEERGRRAAAFHAGFWIALALALLAKGPAALLLVGGAIGLYLLLGRQWRALAQPALWLTAPLLPLVAAPWFVLMSQRHESFDHFFWFQQNVGRFLGSAGAAQHSSGPLYYVGFFPAIFFPWFPLAVIAALTGWRSVWPADTQRRRAALFLLGGAALIFLFFSASDGKLVPYVQPTLPLLALPLAAWLDRRLPRGAQGERHVKLGLGIAGALLVLGAVALLLFGPEALQKYEDAGPMLAIVLAVPPALVGALVILLARRASAGTALAALVGGMVVIFVVLASVYAQLAPNHTSRLLVGTIRPGLDAGARLVVHDAFLPGFTFYSGRTLFIDGGRGELLFGYQQLPPEQLASVWSSDPVTLDVELARPEPVYCVVRDHDAATRLLARLPAGVREIAWNERRSVLGNAAAARLTPPVGHVGVPRQDPP
jgi:4-amino-4-deoxy-L-arabinose transferase-like glycosyltransferase/membrane-associated phospholipid phosphatase